MAAKSESLQLNKESPHEILVESSSNEQYVILDDQNMTQDEEHYDSHVSNCEDSSILQNDRQGNHITHSWTPTSEEKEQLKIQGQSWKQGVWSKEETEQLKQNILDYCDIFSIKNPCEIIFESGKEKRKNFYKTIAKGINRPLFAVYRRCIRMYDSKNHIGKYSVEELKKLQELRKQHGNDWQKIGLAMGRSAASIKDRCRHLKEDCNAGPWTVEEEDHLSEAVFALTQSLPGENSVAGIPWIQIAHRVGSRSERQCRKKWLSYCNMKRIGTTEWNTDDELYLIRRLADSQVIDDKDIAWADLAQSWPRSSVRSHQWLRAKWRVLKRAVKDYENLNLKELCNQLLVQSNMVGLSLLNETGHDNFHSNGGCTGSILSVIGIVPASSITTPIGVNFSIGVGQSPVVLTSPCVTNIPMYLCTTNSIESPTMLPGNNGHSIQFLNNVVQDTEPVSDNVTVVHLDLDGSEEPAVTTDVMFSGSSICSHGSPLGFVDKSDQESENASK